MTIKKLNKIISHQSFWKGTAISLFSLILLNQVVDISISPKLAILGNKSTDTRQAPSLNTESVKVDTAALSQVVVPNQGVQLPISWGNLGQRMIADGVIDEQKFRALFEGGLTAAEETMLTGSMEQPIVMTAQNSRYLLDLLWAFGLANKNDILEKGEMTDEQYGGAANFASTGGWSLSRGEAMDHYSVHGYINLTSEQQDLVDRVSRGVYRPCCGNSTHFPDCNHGMAMLGLLQLMAANGTSEPEMYRVALAVNSYWFPQTYIDLATYFKEQGQEWADVDPQVVLGEAYSSARGYQQIRQQIQSLPKPQSGGGGCGV